MQKIESASGATAIWGSALVVLGQCFEWVSVNATLCGLIIAALGLLIQAFATAHTRRLRNAEEQRRIESHELQMQILRCELAEEVSIQKP